MPQMAMLHEEDPKEAILKKFGDLSGLQLFHADVLVATYLRPNITKGGIVLTDKYADEDKFQGKVGLIIAVGENAFQASGGWWSGGDVGGVSVVVS